jgi:hypothetical protein
MDFYRNGSYINQDTDLGAVDQALTTLGDYGPGGFPWHGIVGEFLIFNSKKTDVDILDFYNATKARYGVE